MEKEAQDMVGLVAKSTWECPPPPLGFTHHKARYKIFIELNIQR
jgi:hypothetical protein